MARTKEDLSSDFQYKRCQILSTIPAVWSEKAPLWLTPFSWAAVRPHTTVSSKHYDVAYPFSLKPHLFSPSSAASTILRVTYGITDSAASNEFESRAEEAFRIVMDTMKPGRFLVEILPICAYLWLFILDCYFTHSPISEIRSQMASRCWFQKIRKILG